MGNIQQIMDDKKIFNFDLIAIKLDSHIQIEAREIVTKGFVNTGIKKNFQVFVRSGDHEPCHFHIKSIQRNFEQKFSIGDLKNISTIQDNRFDAYIRKYFINNNKDLLTIQNKFYELNPVLSV